MNKLLTFEIQDNEKLEIHSNKEGLKHLIDQLNTLYLADNNEHYHLMTPQWGGDDLTEEKQGEKSHLVNHVKIILWQ